MPGDATGLAMSPDGTMVAAGALPAGSTLPATDGSGMPVAASSPLPAQGQLTTAPTPAEDAGAGTGTDAGTSTDTDSDTGAESGTGTDTDSDTDSAADPLPSGDDNSTSTTSPSPTSSTPSSAPAGGSGTAARALKWGTAQQVDDFAGALTWAALSGADGTGRQYTPSAVGVTDGVLTLGATGQGATGGVVADTGVPYGRWEARLRAPAADGYAARLTLSDGDPAGTGTLDFLTLTDGARQRAGAQFGGAAGTGTASVDATGWHNWAVEWTPAKITTYLDGRAWWSVDTAQLGASRTTPLQLGIRVERATGAGTTAAAPTGPLLEVDWVARYKAPATAAASAARTTAGSTRLHSGLHSGLHADTTPTATTAPAEPG